MDLPNKSEPKGPKKDIKPVVSGAVQVNRPATRRFLDFLIAESPKEIATRIGRDVLVPRAKAAVEEAINGFVAGMMWGGGPRPMSNIVKGTVLRGGVQSYSQISTTNAQAQAIAANQQRSSSGNYKDLILPSQESAEFLLANMYDLFNQYRVVTVADLYEMAEITPQPSDNAYGWTSLDGARISKDRNGYLLELPRPSLI